MKTLLAVYARLEHSFGVIVACNGIQTWLLLPKAVEGDRMRSNLKSPSIAMTDFKVYAAFIAIVLSTYLFLIASALLSLLSSSQF